MDKERKKEIDRKYYLSNTEKIRQREYYQAHKERYRAYYRERVERERVKQILSKE